MTKSETNKIMEMQKEGAGYRRIATVLGLPINTVKSYCQRHPIVSTKADNSVCKNCGADLGENASKRNKRFCSDSCRMAWWNQHRYLVNQNAARQISCTHCGKAFSIYGRPAQRFCSRECYQQFRKKVAK